MCGLEHKLMNCVVNTFHCLLYEVCMDSLIRLLTGYEERGTQFHAVITQIHNILL